MATTRFTHTRDAAFLASTVVPLARSFLAFTAAHYPRDGDGVLDMRGARGAETWHNCTNSITDLGGLLQAIPVLKTLSAVLPDDVNTLVAELSKLPPVPQLNGSIAPCSNADYADYGANNEENTELYAMWVARNALRVGVSNGVHAHSIRRLDMTSGRPARR